MKKQNGIVKNSLFLSLATFFLFLGRPCKANSFARPRKSLFPVGKSLGKKSATQKPFSCWKKPWEKKALRKSLFPVGKSLGKKKRYAKAFFLLEKALGKKRFAKPFW